MTASPDEDNGSERRSSVFSWVHLDPLPPRMGEVSLNVDSSTHLLLDLPEDQVSLNVSDSLSPNVHLGRHFSFSGRYGFGTDVNLCF